MVRNEHRGGPLRRVVRIFRPRSENPAGFRPRVVKGSPATAMRDRRPASEEDLRALRAACIRAGRQPIRVQSAWTAQMIVRQLEAKR